MKGNNATNIIAPVIPKRIQVSVEKKTDVANLLLKHFGRDWRSIPLLSFFVHVLGVSLMMVLLTLWQKTTKMTLVNL